MEPTRMPQDVLGWSRLIVSVAICAAALAAMVQLAQGPLGESEYKIVVLTLEFGLCTAVAAAGTWTAARSQQLRRLLGGFTVLAAVVAYGLSIATALIDFSASTTEWWNVTQAVTVIAVVSAQVSLVAQPLRASDGPLLRGLSAVAIASAVGVGLTVFTVLVSVPQEWPSKPWDHVLLCGLVAAVAATASVATQRLVVRTGGTGAEA